MSIHSDFQLSSHQVVSHPTSIVIPQIFHVTEEEKNKNQLLKSGDSWSNQEIWHAWSAPSPSSRMMLVIMICFILIRGYMIGRVEKNLLNFVCVWMVPVNYIVYASATLKKLISNKLLKSTTTFNVGIYTKFFLITKIK